MHVLAQGFALGFLIAAPVGPVGLFVIRRTLRDGWATGAAAGAGVALADGLYAAVAAFGVNALSRFMQQHVRTSGLLAGIVLLFLGVRTIVAALRPSRSESARDTVRGALASAASMFALTLVNPPTLLSFGAAFTLISTRLGPIDEFSALWFAVAALCGSLAWWLILTTIVAQLRARIDDRTQRALTVLCGIGLLVFAGWLLLG